MIDQSGYVSSKWNRRKNYCASICHLHKSNGQWQLNHSIDVSFCRIERCECYSCLCSYNITHCNNISWCSNKYTTEKNLNKLIQIVICVFSWHALHLWWQGHLEIETFFVLRTQILVFFLNKKLGKLNRKSKARHVVHHKDKQTNPFEFRLNESWKNK